MELEITGRLKRIATDGKRMRYDVPVVAIKKNGKSFIAYLNSPARKFTSEIGSGNWYKDDNNQFFLLPSKALNSYRPILRQDGKMYGYIFPTEYVKNGTVKEGHYKIYRCKSGFGFRTYERLEDQDGQ